MNQAPPLPGNKQPVWPKVIGILGIIFGVLGIITSIAYFVISPELISNILPEKQRVEFDDKMARTTLNVTLQLIGLFLSLLMLWGSVLLVRHRASSRKILNLYGVLGVIMGIIAPILMIQAQLTIDKKLETAAIQEVDQQSSDQSMNGQEVDANQEPEESSSRVSDAERENTIRTFSSIFGGVCAGIMSLIWPIIVLCFMNGSKKRATINSWDS
ncbi:MAG: hypothetical protein P8M22_00300 [Phycisphaerales bacterium]|nr:hypothetical protein [Phycisphaerales bacterium]